jgi:hypothetical protein
VPDVGHSYPLLTGRTELKLYPYLAFLRRKGFLHTSVFSSDPGIAAAAAGGLAMTWKSNREGRDSEILRRPSLGEGLLRMTLINNLFFLWG